MLKVIAGVVIICIVGFLVLVIIGACVVAGMADEHSERELRARRCQQEGTDARKSM